VPTIEQRFTAFTKRTEGCDIWQGQLDANGYGRFKLDNKPRRAHRVAYELFIGELSDGAVVHHRCGNRACVRPEHLQATTHQDNLAEMLTRKALEDKIAKLEEENQMLKDRLEHTQGRLNRIRHRV
jgi:hypothetical protein